MNSRIASLSLCGNKNCFLRIPQSWTSGWQSDQVIPLRLEVENQTPIYTSWQGEISSQDDHGSSEVVEINALFGAKHGLRDGMQVVVSPVSNVVNCERAFVEPVSVDDWEVLELHAEYVEGHILDQVRVIWKGQELPLWVNNSICVFVKVELIEPEAECCILEPLTELHIAPKDRNASSLRHKRQQQQQPPTAPSTTAQCTKGASEGGKTETDCGQEPTDQMTVLQWLMHLFRSLLFGSNYKPLQDADTGTSHVDPGVHFDFQPEYLTLEKAVITSLRVQPGPRVEPKLECLIEAVKAGGVDKHAACAVAPLQPTCVYVTECTLKAMLSNCHMSTYDIYSLPHNFLIAMKVSKSLVEREEALNMKTLQKKPVGSKGEDKCELPDDPTKDPEVVVRMVVVDVENRFLLHTGTGSGRVKLREQILLGHMMVNDLLRRQMLLPVTSRVCLMPLSVHNPPVHITAVNLHPLFNTPEGVTSDMMVTAFRKWISDVTSAMNPLVVTNGTLIKIQLLPEFSGEFMLTLEKKVKDEEKKTWPDYCLLHPPVCAAVGLLVKDKITNTEKPKSIPNLPSWNLGEIDPKVPSVTRAQLGGVDEEYSAVLAHMRALLRSHPLSAHYLERHHGQRGGAVLVCGPKGCGKSTFSRAICRALAEHSPLANITVIDCKPLRGKRMDSIQKQLSKAFSEAAWRQPAVLLLDDLDHIAAAPSGPEQEASGEAVYFTRVAEVVKDVLRREVAENSSLVVMVTSKALESLHTSLTASRGHHFFQKVVQLKTPDKAARAAMLGVLLTQRAGVKVAVLDQLDLAALADKTEGYVARDLELLVNRAVHAHRMAAASSVPDQPRQASSKVTRDDLCQALQGFTPMGLRNVTLHSGGDVTWHDVGGLCDVKATLVETLQWPAKYPQLFANCPLRLRQGLLLYGAPGTGKTLLAGAVARECGLNFISIKGPELLSKYIGASEQAVRQTFERAQSAKPCILFFDEFDSLAPRRGHDSTGVTDRVVNQLLTQLDGVEGLQGVYVLAATSRPDLIDPALLRPGRLDKALNCTLPSKAERVEILTALSRHMRLGDDVDLPALAALTSHFTGADLKALLYNAQLDAIHASTNLWDTTLSANTSDTLRRDQELLVPTTPDTQGTAGVETTEAALPGEEQQQQPVVHKPPPERTTSFEYLLPDGGSRPRSSSSSGSSDHSVGQSPSWEVVAMVTEKPRPEMSAAEVGGLGAAGAGGGNGKAGGAAAAGRVVRERLAYMPNVEEGVVQLSPVEQDQVLHKVHEEYMSGEAEAEVKDVRDISLIYQRHLVSACRNMHPSVTEKERQKYLSIYERFNKSKGENFGEISSIVGQRATLA